VGRSCGGGVSAFGSCVRDRSRILTQQERDRILLLLNLLLQLRNLRGRGVEQLLRLANIGERHRSAALQRLGQVDESCRALSVCLVISS
jgi:hypothetical protein